MNTVASRSHGRDNNFNVLRMIAATLVVWLHSVTLNNGLAASDGGHRRPDWSGEFIHAWTGTDAGTLGVSVFFVISGFLLARSLTLDSSLRDFFVKRSLRLFPALVLVLVLVLTSLGIGLVFTTLDTADYLTRPATWGYIANNLIFYSYGTYLWGFPLQQVMVATLPRMSYGVFFLVALLVTLIPAAISWHLVEERALKLKRRWSRRLAPASAPLPLDPGTLR